MKMQGFFYHYYRIISLILTAAVVIATVRGMSDEEALRAMMDEANGPNQGALDALKAHMVFKTSPLVFLQSLLSCAFVLHLREIAPFSLENENDWRVCWYLVYNKDALIASIPNGGGDLMNIWGSFAKVIVEMGSLINLADKKSLIDSGSASSSASSSGNSGHNSWFFHLQKACLELAQSNSMAAATAIGISPRRIQQSTQEYVNAVFGGLRLSVCQEIFRADANTCQRMFSMHLYTLVASADWIRMQTFLQEAANSVSHYDKLATNAILGNRKLTKHISRNFEMMIKLDDDRWSIDNQVNMPRLFLEIHEYELPGVARDGESTWSSSSGGGRKSSASGVSSTSTNGLFRRFINTERSRMAKEQEEERARMLAERMESVKLQQQTHDDEEDWEEPTSSRGRTSEWLRAYGVQESMFRMRQTPMGTPYQKLRGSRRRGKSGGSGFVSNCCRDVDVKCGGCDDDKSDY